MLLTMTTWPFLIFQGDGSDDVVLSGVVALLERVQLHLTGHTVMAENVRLEGPAKIEEPHKASLILKL